MFNHKLKGMPLDSIDTSIEEYIISQMSSNIKVIKPILKEMKKAIDEQGNLYYEGTNKAFELPEFKSMEIGTSLMK